MRVRSGWLVLIAGCRGFFDTPPIVPEAAPPTPVTYIQGGTTRQMAVSLIVPFPLVTQAGDLVLVSVSWFGSGTTISTFGDGHNMYTGAVGPQTSGGGEQLETFVATNIAGGRESVQVMFSTATDARLVIAEYAGAARVAATTTAMGINSTADSGPLAASPHDLGVAMFASDAITTNGTFPGFTTRQSGVDFFVGDHDADVATVDAASAGTVDGHWIVQLVLLSGS
jgi:hypothetical protein